MKMHKMICLDPEIIEKLKGENISSLVNSLLSDYVKRNDLNSMSEDELKKALAIEEAREEFKKKLRSIQSGNIE